MAAALVGAPGASRVHEHAAHDPGGHGEEVGPVLPVHAPRIHESNVRLVHERSGLKALRHTIAAQAATRDLAQLVMNQRDEPRQRVLVPASPFQQKRRDVRNRWQTGPILRCRERVRVFATAFRLSKQEGRNGGENTGRPVNGGGSNHG